MLSVPPGAISAHMWFQPHRAGWYPTLYQHLLSCTGSISLGLFPQGLSKHQAALKYRWVNGPKGPTANGYESPWINAPEQHLQEEWFRGIFSDLIECPKGSPRDRAQLPTVEPSRANPLLPSPPSPLHKSSLLLPGIVSPITYKQPSHFLRLCFGGNWVRHMNSQFGIYRHRHELHKLG